MSYAYGPQAWYPHPYPVRTTAPVSVHVVAIFQYLGGLLTLALATMLGLAAAGLLPRLEYQAGDTTWSNVPAEVTAVVAVVCGVIAFVGFVAIWLGRKVQRGRNWARIILIALNLLSVAGAVAEGFAQSGWVVPSDSYVIGSMLAALAFPVLFLLLLNTRAARSWCHHRTY